MFGGSWKIARFAGIDIFVHWSFALLIFYVMGTSLWAGETMSVALHYLVLVLALFVCIVMHEYGHALTARRFGVRTRRITLLPFGGTAELEKMPDKPWQELLVAVAGPAVNVVIAVILAGVLYAMAGVKGVTDISWISKGVPGFLAQLMVANIVLVVFNMIPAFPMDGGRVLRSILAMRMDYVRATNFAATVGRVIAVGFGIYALYSFEPFLILIALFIFTAGGAEARFVQAKSLIAGFRVKDVMVKDFSTVTPLTRLSDLAGVPIPGSQQDFPVLEREHLAGMLYQVQLVAAIAQQKQDQNVGSIMATDFETAHPDDSLLQLIERMQATGVPTFPVLEDERLVGLVSAGRVNEWMRIQAAQRVTDAKQGVREVTAEAPA